VILLVRNGFAHVDNYRSWGTKPVTFITLATGQTVHSSPGSRHEPPQCGRDRNRPQPVL